MNDTDKAVFPGRFDSLAAISEFACRAAREAGLDEQGIYNVQLAVDEACANIIDHAYGGEGKGDIECSCRADPGELTVTLRDRGRRFDPTSIGEPDLTSELEDRQVGGLGLYLMGKVMDEVRFDFDESGNALTMVKRKESSP